MNTPAMKTRPTPRAEDTRRRIYEAAMEIFREKGFEQATMRDIAAKAGVALGGAYYYYSSKEAIVLSFYQDMQSSSHDAILQAMAGQKKLKDRLRCVMEKRFELLAPNRKFCDALFRHAPDSQDPLSPFSEQARAIRERSIEHLRIALEGGDVKVPGRLEAAASLPALALPDGPDPVLAVRSLAQPATYGKAAGKEPGPAGEPAAPFPPAFDEALAQDSAGVGGDGGAVSRNFLPQNRLDNGRARNGGVNDAATSEAQPRRTLREALAGSLTSLPKRRGTNLLHFGPDGIASRQTRLVSRSFRPRPAGE